MKKWISALVVLCFLGMPVSAMDFTAPTVPEAAQEYMPDSEETFAEGLLYILKKAISELAPELAKASSVCLSLIAVVLLLRVFSSISKKASASIRLTGAVVIGLLLLEPVNAMVQLGTDTITELSEYGKMLIPVMTATMAAQGGTTTSAALYAGTVFFNSLLTGIISKFIVPALYIYLCLCVAGCAVEQDMLTKVQEFAKWTMTTILKWVLYIFTGYITITGVISGTVDASALKAAQVAISGMVPVVGGILSGASETVLLSAGMMKGAAGVYGIFAILALCVSPFIQIGAQYLLLKVSGAVCNVFGYTPAVSLVQKFSSGMGIVLAMTAAVSVLLLISLVCFMKGMT